MDPGQSPGVLHRGVKYLTTSVSMVIFFFLFLGLINIFMGSLLSIPLHKLELISFSPTPDNKCCHGNIFFCFLDL